MDFDELRISLQQHFTDGLVLIIGCGLSSAEGMPGMEELKIHLSKQIPKKVSSILLSEWEEIERKLTEGMNIEDALASKPPSDELQKLIVESAGNLMLLAEKKTIEEVVSGKKTLRFTRLIKHLLKPNTGIPIVTTNYDRLLEIACEQAGLGIDTLFCGYNFGVVNPKESRLSLCRKVEVSKSGAVLKFREHATILKPHGSLDWYRHKDEPIRSPIELNLPRLIITPGLNKYREGYNTPFDIHRDHANKEIDRARGYFILGYGFNDQHLETHLHPQLRAGKPAVVLTKQLTANGEALISDCRNMKVICSDTEKKGILVRTHNSTDFFLNSQIWDLNNFIDEVLEPWQ